MKRQILIFFSSFLELISLIYLFLMKYNQQDLGWGDFNFLFIGNIINYLLSIFIIFLFLWMLFANKRIDMVKIQLLLIYEILSILTLFSADFFYVFKIDDMMISIFGYYSDKIFISVFFIIFQSIKYLLLFSNILILFSDTKKPFWNSLIYTLFIHLIFVFVSFCLTYFIQDKIDNEYLKGHQADAIVVLGAAVWSNNQASPVFMGRIKKASELYKSKYALRIVVTGGHAPGEMSEAKVAKRELIKIGIPEKKIYIEEKTKSTIQQMLVVRKIFENNKNIKDIIIVSDQFHLFRIYAMSKFLNIEINYVSSGTRLNLGTEFWFRLRESFSLILYCLFGV